MDMVRILIVLFLVGHGIGHTIWFLAAWSPVSTGVRDGSWLLPGEVTIRDPAGRALGLLALGATLAFLVAAWTLLGRDPAWQAAAAAGCAMSFVAVIPWARQSPGMTAALATAGNVGLLAVLALPLGQELIAAG
jgi:hypothetical protein